MKCVQLSDICIHILDSVEEYLQSPTFENDLFQVTTIATSALLYLVLQRGNLHVAFNIQGCL